MKHVDDLADRAVKVACNLRAHSPAGFVYYRKLMLARDRGEISIPDYIALLGVVQREEAKWAGKVNYMAPFRPQPTDQDGLADGPIKLPFTIVDSNSPLSLTDELCAGGIAIVGALQSGKTVRAAHIVKAFFDAGKTIVAFVSKGITDWHFLARDGYPVLFLTAGRTKNTYDSLYFNPLTCEGGPEEIYAQLNVLAVCSQRKDSFGLSVHAAEHFFAIRKPEDRAQLTFSKLCHILTTEVTPRNHKFSYQHTLWPSLLNTIQTFPLSYGNCFRCEKGIDLEALIRSRGSLFVDTSKLTLAQDEYLIASMGWKFYHTGKRLHAGLPDSQSRTVLFVDECSPHLTSRLDQDQRHFGPISELMLKARGG